MLEIHYFFYFVIYEISGICVKRRYYVHSHKYSLLLYLHYPAEYIKIMHEMTIAQNIIDIINESINAEDISSVRFIRIRAGMLSNIMIESLISSFDAIKTETPLQNATLEIEEVPVTFICKGCGKTSVVNDFSLRCPFCSGSDIEVTGGNELDLAEIKINKELS